MSDATACRICECGADYSHRSPSAVTCGAADCVRARRKRLASVDREERLSRRREEYALAHPQASQRSCEECGRAMSRHPNAKYCSDRCKRRSFSGRHPEYFREWERARGPKPPTSPEKQAAYNKNRRARRLGNRDHVAILPAAWSRLLRKSRGCFYCGRSNGPLSMDHVVPLARGGRHAEGNAVLACLTCNKSKGSKLLAEWKQHPSYARRIACPPSASIRP